MVISEADYKKLSTYLQKIQEILDNIPGKDELYETASRVKCSQIDFGIKRFNTRFMGACYRHDLKTLQDLLSLGKLRFSKTRNVGDELIRRLSDILYDKYGIDNW